MESFKKALKQAIQEKAEAVRIEDGQHPHLLHFSSEKPLLNLPVMNLAEVQALMEALVANGEALGPTAREGVLAIVNYGEIKLIAQLTTPLKLYAFIPPQGNQMHQQIRNQVLGPQKPTPAAIDIPPPVAAEDDGIGRFAMTKGEESPAPEVPSLAPRKTPLPVGDDMFDSGAPVSPGQSAALAKATAIAPNFDSIPAYVPGESSIDDDSLSPRQTQLSEVRNEFATGSSQIAGLPYDSNLSIPASISDLSSSDLDYHYQSSHSALSPALDSAAQHDFQPQVAQAYRPPADEPFPQAAQPYQAPLDNYPAPAAYQPQPAPSHAHYAPPEPLQASAPAEIHFGALIPGESIDRAGRDFPIDTLLRDMIQRKASDLHLTQGEILCMRIDGEITRVGGDPLSEARMKELLLPIMPPRNKEEFSKVSDTDFAYEVPGLARFRVNIFRDRMGVGAVLRQIPEKILSADDLGLPPAVRKFCELNKGLVVVTGPTGSGKSTTLAGMIDLINESRSEHILTIEDPIEFVHKQKKCLINQREVHKHTQSFSRALRAALREDPDIILIGEMRDLETVEIAIETAETGHLVFGTLHTNTAISTVDRLIDQFPADQQAQIRVMLAESLKGVVAQTLVRKKGGGRVAALEILVIDKAVASLIREGNTHMMGNHMQTQKAKGNILLNESLLNLVTKGLVDAKDAYMKAVEKESFLALLQSKGIALDVQKAS